MGFYLERCRESAAAIDPSVLESLAPGRLHERERGSSFDFRSLGTLRIGGSEQQHVGVKTPRLARSMAGSRLVEELALVDLVSTAVPPLQALVPSFMCLLNVEGSDATGILTEDASRNRALEVISRPASMAVRSLLYTPFAEAGPISTVLSQHECERTVAFDVGGEERLLDFTPPPVCYSALFATEAFSEATSRAIRAARELTITLPQDSVLGQSLHSMPLG